MAQRQDFEPFWKRVSTSSLSYLPSAGVIGGVGLLLLGAGVIYMLPEGKEEAPVALASATPAVSEEQAACDKQAWPYMDQRCAQRVDKARGTRQVRIVTDKGHSVTAVTPLPVVEAKPQPPKPLPAVAQNDRPKGPAAAPAAAGKPAQQDIAAAASKPEPQASNSTRQAALQPAKAPEPQPAVPAPEPAANAAKAMASANVPPSAASDAPVAPGVDAIDDTRPKSKSARKAERDERRAIEKAQKREARRMRRIEEETGSVPQEVVDAVRFASEERMAERRGKKRMRNGVPDDVVAAVEAEAGRRGDRAVTLESPRGRRVIVVPAEGLW